MKIKIYILCIVVIVGVLFFLSKISVKKTTNPGDIFFDNQKKLGRMVRKDGIYKAYAYFSANFKSFDPSTNHYLGHYLGEEAYRSLGEKGFDVCNYGLDYGCTHGFVIAGINVKGEGFFQTVMERCMQIDPTEVKRGSCIHGVSHTILSLKGYSDDDLNWALNKCDKTLINGRPEDPVMCYSAVFMENNLMSLDGIKNGEWFVTRKFDSEKPIYPCDKLDEKYEWACYSELGSFWSNNFGMDFSRMAKFCNLATSVTAKNGCLWGIGRTMADLYKYDVPRIGKECQKISPADNLPSCINGASVVMLNNGADNASSICGYTSVRDTKNCTSYFQNNKSL